MRKTGNIIIPGTGYFVIAIGLLFNEFTIKHFFGWGGYFDSCLKSSLLLVIQIAVIAGGIFIVRERAEALKKTGLFFSGLCISLLLIEFILSMEFMQDLKSDSPLWIPAKYKNISTEIDKAHRASAQSNEFGFNDVDHPRMRRDSSMIRIAVLGDSFIWGAGVPDSVIWTRKLAERFKADSISCEILNWGKSGWSTRDEFNFLISRGSRFDIDHLVFAFVVNDPSSDASSHRQLITKDGIVDRIFLHPVSLIFPNTVSFFTDALNNATAALPGFGYVHWLEKVYSPPSLTQYAALLTEIRIFCDTNHVRFSFILTPENHTAHLGEYFRKIVPLLDSVGIKYLDLYPYIASELGAYPARTLWANPADGHPGDRVTSVYADHVYTYLRSELLSSTAPEPEDRISQPVRTAPNRKEKI